jgi:hypothetical protein
MRLTLWHAPAFLLLYQTAPIQARFDEVGRFRLALGLSRGGYSNERFDCEGNVTERAKVRYTAVSGQLDAWLTPGLRLSAGGGVLDGSTDSTWANESQGGFGSVLLAEEGQTFGYGGGLAFWPQGPGEPTRVLPSVYFRAGRVDRVHFRIDETASVGAGSPPVYRLGAAGGYGTALQPRWFIGLIGWTFPQEGNQVGFGGELGIPLGRVQPVLTAGIRPDQGETDWNVGAGIRVGLGRRPR